jgi:hypothetical protein
VVRRDVRHALEWSPRLSRLLLIVAIAPLTLGMARRRRWICLGHAVGPALTVPALLGNRQHDLPGIRPGA